MPLLDTKTWDQRKADLGRKNAAPSLELIAEIESELLKPHYVPYADVIKGNLAAEYFKREEARKTPAAPAPAVVAVPNHTGAPHGHATPFSGNPPPGPVVKNSGNHPP
ncbi:MAG: hypothetical protein ACRC1H_10305 [Caldilineaceae bacterium]